MTVHELKTWPEYYDAAVAGDKTFEVRADDRGYQQGDRLLLRRYDPGSGRYDGREAAFDVTYLLRGGDFGVAPGHVVMAIRPVRSGVSR